MKRSAGCRCRIMINFSICYIQVFDTHIANGVGKGEVIAFTWLAQGLVTEINGKVMSAPLSAIHTPPVGRV